MNLKQSEVGCGTVDWSHVVCDRPVAASAEHVNESVVAIQRDVRHYRHLKNDFDINMDRTS